MNRLQTPHSGYHWRGNSDRFFEGWYYRVTLPEDGQSFAFMYSIEDPMGDRPCSGGAAQVLGVNDEYLCRTFPDTKRFWASCDRLAFLHWGSTRTHLQPQILPPDEFFQLVDSGYQATDTRNQGAIADPSSGNYCRWDYTIETMYGWGNLGQKQQSTAGWLSFLPIFEPGWQVLMASGKATGYIEWNGKRYKFSNAPAYAEKNWGGSFPSKWFWINSNTFEKEPDLALTAVGAYRQVLWWMECVGAIGLHYRGKYYEFSTLKSDIDWQIAPWGTWQMTGVSDRYKISLTGISDRPGNYVRVPTERGLVFECRDTTHGRLKLEMRDRFTERVLVNAESYLAGLEIGGKPWQETWKRVMSH